MCSKEPLELYAALLLRDPTAGLASRHAAQALIRAMLLVLAWIQGYQRSQSNCLLRTKQKNQTAAQQRRLFNSPLFVETNLRERRLWVLLEAPFGTDSTLIVAVVAVSRGPFFAGVVSVQAPYCSPPVFSTSAKYSSISFWSRITGQRRRRGP
jgi:hypothetical protein